MLPEKEEAMCDETQKHEAAKPEGADSRRSDTFLHDLSLKAQEGYRLMEKDGDAMEAVISAIRGLGAPDQGSGQRL